MRLSVSILMMMVLLAVGCRDKKEAPSTDKTPTNVPTPTPVYQEEVLDSPIEGLSIIRLRPGSGGETVSMGRGVLLGLRIEDGGEHVWSGHFAFDAGSGQASNILEAGILGATHGEERRLELSPDLVESAAITREPGTPRVYHLVVEHIGDVTDYLESQEHTNAGRSN